MHLSDYEILQLLRRDGLHSAARAVSKSNNLDFEQAKNYVENISKRQAAQLDIRVELSLLEEFKDGGYIDDNSLAKLKQALVNQKDHIYISRDALDLMKLKKETFDKTGLHYTKPKKAIKNPNYSPRPAVIKKESNGLSKQIIFAIAALTALVVMFIIINNNQTAKENSNIAYNDSVSNADFLRLDSITKSMPDPPKQNIEKDYKIITTDHQPTTENYHLALTKKKRDVEYVQSIATSFRQQHCKKQCNIYLYDKRLNPSLVLQYPLADFQYLEVADHLVATSTFENYTVWMYPYQDFHYKELGGKNWKKEPIK